MLNHICIQGRLVKDPELRNTVNGTPVANFTIACERDRETNGERLADFVEIVVWNRAAEFASKYFHKGSMVNVSGRLQSRKWQDRDGNNRISWEIVAESTYFCESKKREDPQLAEMEEGDLPF